MNIAWALHIDQNGPLFLIPCFYHFDVKLLVPNLMSIVVTYEQTAYQYVKFSFCDMCLCTYVQDYKPVKVLSLDTVHKYNLIVVLHGLSFLL